MKSISVQVLLMSDLSIRHGGNLWAIHLLETLRTLSNIRICVVSVASASARAGNAAIIESFGHEHEFIPLNPKRTHATAASERTCLESLSETIRDKYYIPLEELSKAQAHIDHAIVDLVKDRRPDVVLLTYLYNALLAPSLFKLETRPCIVIANDEVAFYKQHRKNTPSGRTGGCAVMANLIRRHANWLGTHRLRAFQDRIYSRCIGLAALSATDIPANLPDHTITSVISPILEESAIRWRYTSSRRLFFVGNIEHFPNRLAIEWLCRHFSPELLKIDQGVTIDIIGAELTDVPPRWRARNIRFLGISTKDEVVRQMTTTDLMIAPIENGFGSKLKLAECLSHGTPFLATQGALSGLRFLKSLPQIFLHQPQAAAKMAMDYLNNPATLEGFSRSILTQARQERVHAPVAWQHFLESVAARQVYAKQ